MSRKRRAANPSAEPWSIGNEGRSLRPVYWSQMREAQTARSVRFGCGLV